MNRSHDPSHQRGQAPAHHKESKLKTTAPNLIRLSGLSAVAAGILFVFVGLLHPAETPAAVATGLWAIVHAMAFAVCGFGAVSSSAFAPLPHELEPLATVPVVIGLAWLGYALVSERRESASAALPGRATPQLRPTAAA